MTSILMGKETELQSEIDRLLANYLREVDESNLKPLSAQSYRAHAIHFVRWIKGDFKLGEKNKRS